MAKTTNKENNRQTKEKEKSEIANTQNASPDVRLDGNNENGNDNENKNETNEMVNLMRIWKGILIKI